MSSSEDVAYRRFPWKRFINDDPLHVYTARKAVVGNLLHMYDEATQHHVNWSAQSTSLRIEHTLTAADTWEYVRSFGPFPVRRGLDGLPSPLVVRIGGSVSAGQGQFRVRITGHTIAAGTSITPYSASLTIAGITSTTDAWVGSGRLNADAAQWSDAEYLEGISVARTDGSSTTEIALWFLARADLWAYNNGTNTNRFAGLLVREYIGGGS